MFAPPEKKLSNLLEARIIFLYAHSLSKRRTHWVVLAEKG